MKHFYTLFILSLLVAHASAQVVDSTIDDPGDIAIVAYHDLPDGFSFVFLDNCPNGTTIRFVDEEWTGSSFASVNTEGEVLWTNDTGATISQGNVVHIERADDNGAGILASIGLAEEVNGGFSLDLTDDEIIAITGTRSSPGVFLTFFGKAYSGNTLSGTSLINEYTALRDATVTEGRYTGSTSCSGIGIWDCAKQLNNPSNWTFGSFTYTTDVISSMNLSGVLHTDSQELFDVQMGPNPVSDILNVSSSRVIQKIELYDVFGKQKLVKDDLSMLFTISLSDYQPGFYYLKFYFENETSVQTVIKK